MHTRAQELIRTLRLEPHIEGGHYRRIYESASRVGYTGNEQRAAATSIYFLLADGELSRWHRVDADEVWHFYEGQPLELLRYDPAENTLTTHTLGPASRESAPVFVVPAGMWQAARPRGAYTLVGCTVAPGYEYRGFSLLDQAPEVARQIEELNPDLMDLA
ncbi:cupin domain-containing protein [Tahibacter amnicola]|uniref:Cupin domain-containing protein n=1 Tax=Tahibacter amnicola TaxID=2976241 RepID=A0ABY6BMI1_9GAMM|nr:cupin domain-containing protein [Tahibacter amnicola]UXI69595.1 cupin domain-containing protein [Tahibacter amnicola]